MKHLLIFLAGVCLWAGCASPDVNPPVARAGSGYVDFYTIGGGNLDWEVAGFDGQIQRYRILFSEFNPPPNGVLRLALSPGRHRLRVTFLNRVIREPAACVVEVATGKITPVHVVLTEDSLTQVQGQDGPEASRYRISLVVNAPMAYRVKGQMPYAQ